MNRKTSHPHFEAPTSAHTACGRPWINAAPSGLPALLAVSPGPREVWRGSHCSFRDSAVQWPCSEVSDPSIPRQRPSAHICSPRGPGSLQAPALELAKALVVVPACRRQPRSQEPGHPLGLNPSCIASSTFPLAACLSSLICKVMAWRRVEETARLTVPLYNAVTELQQWARGHWAVCSPNTWCSLKLTHMGRFWVQPQEPS